jgi:hypothetical protein
MARGAAERAEWSAKEDKGRRLAETSSDSKSDEDVNLKERNRNMHQKLCQEEEETERLQREIDAAAAKNREKLKELAAVRNAYQVIVIVSYI